MGEGLFGVMELKLEGIITFSIFFKYFPIIVCAGAALNSYEPGKGAQLAFHLNL